MTPLGGFNPPPVLPWGGGAGRARPTASVSPSSNPPILFLNPSQIPSNYISAGSMTPPFSSPGAPAFRQASPKKRCRHLKLEIKIRSKFGYVFGAVLGRKSGQHGPNLAPKMEPKTAQNRAKIDAKIHRKNRCLSGSIFDAILMDFGRENGGKLAP